MDILFLKEFRIELIIGIYEWERKVPQPVILDLEIGLRNSRAGETDRVDDTIDYGQVAARIQTTACALRPMLVEALAEHVAQLVLSEFDAPWVKVTVTKLAIVRGVKQLGICIERGQRL